MQKSTPSNRKRQGGAVAVRTHGDPPPRPERIPVVIEASADGWIRVFAPTHCDVRFVNRVLVHSAAAATLADEYAELQLPRPHRDVYRDHPRLQDQVRRVTVADEAERLLQVDLLAECRAIASELGRLPQAVPA